MDNRKPILGALFVTASLLPNYVAAAGKPWWDSASRLSAPNL
jgi:hypothetical protein